MNPGAQQKTILKNIPQQIEQYSKNDSQIGPRRRTKTKKTQQNISKTEPQNEPKKTTIFMSKHDIGGREHHMWGPSKTSHSEKSIAKH